jgi:hypothetical protein
MHSYNCHIINIIKIFVAIVTLVFVDVLRIIIVVLAIMSN